MRLKKIESLINSHISSIRTLSAYIEEGNYDELGGGL